VENKQKVLNHIQTHPGQTLSQIHYRLKIPQTTIKHHITQLISENKITKEEIFKTRYFLNSTNTELRIKSSIENNNSIKNIYQNLVNEMTLDEISLICNTSKSLVSRRLKMLISSRLVEKTKKDGKIIFKKKIIT
jgi:predicted transcriptional regulator